MLKIDRNSKTLTQLESKKLSDVGLLERADLQQMILHSPDAFFGEMGETLYIVGDEIRPTDFVSDRIDLLALDSDGTAVILELKRASNKLHLLQALSYAGMIAKWSPDSFIEETGRTKSREVAAAEIEEFLEQAELETINRSQRVILIAEDFDYEVLVTAEWLYERFEVDIRCYRVALAADTSDEFLTCTRIYPPPELTAQAKRRGGRSPLVTTGEVDWKSALANVENSAVIKFFQSEIDSGRQYSRRGVLRFRAGERLRYRIAPKRSFAYVSQRGRFQDDEIYWTTRVSFPMQVRPVAGGRRLRFRLHTEEDFQKFRKAWDEDLQTIPFVGGSANLEADDTLDSDDNDAEE